MAAARSYSISCSHTAHISASNGSGRPADPQAGIGAHGRPDQRVKPEPLVESRADPDRCRAPPASARSPTRPARGARPARRTGPGRATAGRPGSPRARRAGWSRRCRTRRECRASRSRPSRRGSRNVQRGRTSTRTSSGRHRPGRLAPGRRRPGVTPPACHQMHVDEEAARAEDRQRLDAAAAADGLGARALARAVAAHQRERRRAGDEAGGGGGRRLNGRQRRRRDRSIARTSASTGTPSTVSSGSTSCSPGASLLDAHRCRHVDSARVATIAPHMVTRRRSGSAARSARPTILDACRHRSTSSPRPVSTSDRAAQGRAGA